METKETQQFEKCRVYVDSDNPARLRFSGDINGRAVSCRMLSTALDFADFSHFEYADPEIGKSLFSRWIHHDSTMYPDFVVFHKKP